MNEPVPIHDIVGPVWFLPWPLWLVITVAATAVALLGIAAWAIKAWFSRKPPLTNKQRALAALDALRSNMPGTDPYAFGVVVSDIIRTYIHAQHGLRATTQTSLEFLDAIRDNPIFSANEKSGLAVFLENTDLLKYARIDTGESERIGLLETAARLVRAEVQPTPEGSKK